MEKGSTGARWLSFFPALIQQVSGTNRISCSLTHPAVYRSQVKDPGSKVSQFCGLFFFSNLTNSVIHLTRLIQKWLRYHKWGRSHR